MCWQVKGKWYIDRGVFVGVDDINYMLSSDWTVMIAYQLLFSFFLYTLWGNGGVIPTAPWRQSGSSGLQRSVEGMHERI